METSVALRPSVQGALSRLVDYAGLFPPAQLSLAQATAQYRDAQRGAHAWMLGRFIISATTLVSSPQPGAGPFSVILDAAPDLAEWLESVASRIEAVALLRSRGVRVEALEVSLPAGFTAERTPDEAVARLRELLECAKLSDIPTYVEFARRGSWKAVVERSMAAMARTGCGAKLRCGGLEAAAFPSVEEVVEFIAAAVAARVPFKATAGLHHPVRRLDTASGFVMHGFLNILTAAALAPHADRSILERIVAEEDSTAFRFDARALYWDDVRIDLDRLETSRRDAFVGYGSCSFSEPVEDLTSLGVFAAL